MSEPDEKPSHPSIPHLWRHISSDENSPKLEEMISFLPNLSKESERGLALIACSFLEQSVKDILKSFIIEDEISLRLINGFNSPLGSFSASLTAAYALALISKSEFEECNRLRNIRNDFAHKVNVSFNMKSVRDRCNNLTMGEHDPTKAFGSQEKFGARERYTRSATLLITYWLARPKIVSAQRRKFEGYSYR